MTTRTAYDPWKRFLDCVVASVALAITAPVQAVIALLVRRDLGPPVLFRQQRPGRDEEIFELVKFRTMLEPDPARGVISDEDRMTRLGAFLRSTSLDELPTLWNVLRGDMSLVGPRPLLVQYVQRYSPEQRLRHQVRPGITGLAQIGGRNALSWEDRFRRDLDYIAARSLALDLKIILRTARMVIRREGITDGASPTMSEYMGPVDPGTSPHSEIPLHHRDSTTEAHE